jgi:hypothetical protein
VIVKERDPGLIIKHSERAECLHGTVADLLALNSVFQQIRGEDSSRSRSPRIADGGKIDPEYETGGPTPWPTCDVKQTGAESRSLRWRRRMIQSAAL